MVLVDTNVLLDIATRDAKWFSWSAGELAPLINSRQAAINPVIYAELAPHFRDAKEMDGHLLSPATFKRLPLPYSAGFPAARAFLAYRKAGGAKSSPLPDFLIGGHAEAENLTILTRDAARYRTYFPNVRLICPPNQ
jgi:predicted nucleic acid-binding protein